MIIVHLLAATICFLGQCHPALVGKKTPIGEFSLIHRYVVARGYGGDVLQFDKDKTGIYAIHRVWLGDPAEMRQLRIKSKNVRDRYITHGCINVEPNVYEQLLAIDGEKLIVEK
jgi:hypothetical protein